MTPIPQFLKNNFEIDPLKVHIFNFLKGRYFVMIGTIDMNVGVFWETSLGFLKVLFRNFSQNIVRVISNHGYIILNRDNNSVLLCLKVHWNRQAFYLIHASGIWMKFETLRHQASSSKFLIQYFKLLVWV